MSRYSIQQLTLSYSLIALALMVLLSVASLFVVKQNLEEQNRQARINDLRTKADRISQVIDFYRNIVSKIARQNNIVDMLLFQDDDYIQRWAVNLQNIIPQSIGISLFDKEGSIRGSPVTLRLGEECVTDIHKFINQGTIANPPVHNRNKEFEHFDLYEKLNDDEGFIGAVFVSFSLGVLRDVLERMTQPGEQLALLSGSGQLIAQNSKLTSSRNYVYNAAISGADWKLRASYAEHQLGSLLAFIGAINALMFLLVYLVLYVLSRKLIRLFTDDFKTIQSYLQSVKSHPDEHKTIRHSALKETGEIVSNVQLLADDISQLTDFSKTDELTGIPNRRAFNTEITRYIQLAHRNMKVSVVVVDVDYFKQANDRYGHIVGDAILRILGDALNEMTRETDTCARLGGDEFVAILISSDSDSVISWFQRLAEEFARRQLSQITEIEDAQPVCSLSAGFTGIRATDTKAEPILHRADSALYDAKAAGRATIRAYREGSPAA